MSKWTRWCSEEERWQGMWLKAKALRIDLIRLKGHAPSSSSRLFPLIVSHSLQKFFILTVCEAKGHFM